VIWFGNRERVLFTSLDPPYRRPEWAVGSVVGHKGAPYRITRWVECDPVRLRRGGSVRQWQVWGRRVSDKELREELDGVTARILSGEK
jgi:hypothetical protein